MKNYARFFKQIFANQEKINDEELNNNQEFVETMQALLEGLYHLEYIAVNDYVCEGKTLKEFADYLRKNADEIADSIMAGAYRKMRHPKRSGELRQFCIYNDED